MLTGRQAFQGEDVGDILATVVKTEPDWSLLPESTPPAIRMLLRRCLRKDRRQRLQDAATCVSKSRTRSRALRRVPGEAVPARQRKSRERIAWAVVASAIVIAALALGAVAYFRPAPEAALPPMHLSADIGVDATCTPRYGAAAILSPDGTRLAFVASGADQRRRIYIRSLDAVAGRPAFRHGECPQSLLFARWPVDRLFR